MPDKNLGTNFLWVLALCLFVACSKKLPEPAAPSLVLVSAQTSFDKVTVSGTVFGIVQEADEIGVALCSDSILNAETEFKYIILSNRNAGSFKTIFNLSSDTAWYVRTYLRSKSNYFYSPNTIKINEDLTYEKILTNYSSRSWILQRYDVNDQTEPSTSCIYQGTWTFQYNPNVFELNVCGNRYSGGWQFTNNYRSLTLNGAFIESWSIQEFTKNTIKLSGFAPVTSGSFATNVVLVPTDSLK